MNDKIFVDTNILVYARDSSENEKQPTAQKWLNLSGKMKMVGLVRKS